MRTVQSLSLHASAAVLFLASLSGCTTFSAKSDTGTSDFSSLYDGKSKAAFATLLPVSSPQEALQRGDLAVADGDLDRALFEYIRALELDDANATALYKIGTIHAVRGNPRLAEIAFRLSLTEDADNVGALTGLGVLLLEKRNYPEARGLLERAITINDGIVRAHNALGVMSDLEGDYQAAQHHYQRALEASPATPALLNNLGYSRYMSGDWSKATAAFREALLIDPNYDRAWRNLALVYTRQERYEDAIDALTKIEDLPQAYNDVGYIAMVAGKLGKANELFAEAKRLSPNFYAMADTNLRRVELLQGHTAAP